MNEKEAHIASSGCPVSGRYLKEEKMQLDETAVASADVSSAADYDEPLDFSSRREEDSADATDQIERKISRDSGVSVGYGSVISSTGIAGKRSHGCNSPSAAGGVAVAAAAEQQQRRRQRSSRSPSPCSLSGDSDRTGSAAGVGSSSNGVGSVVGSAESYMNPALAAIPGAVFPGFPAFFAQSLHPGLAAQGHSLWPMAAAAAAVNPLAALIQDQQRKLMAAAAAAAAATGGTSGSKAAANGHCSAANPRPFKQYRDSMSMPLSYYAMPPFLHVPGTVESAAMAQIMKTQSDELLNLYKQQLGVADAQDKLPLQQQQPVHQPQQQSQSQQRRPKDASASSSPAVPATVSTPSPTTIASGSSSGFKQHASSVTSVAGASASASDSQVLPGVTVLEPTPIKATKVESSCPLSSAAGLPPAGGDSPALASSALGTVASSAFISGSPGPANMAVNMSSASSTHSSLSSDGEGFGASPSSALAAPLPTSTTGRSGTQLPRKRTMRTLPTEQKDDAYWERRRKNNEAAKRSRDARRAKEDEIAIRAAFLEQENLRLRVDLAAVRQEVEKLRAALVAQQTVKSSDGVS